MKENLATILQVNFRIISVVFLLLCFSSVFAQSNSRERSAMQPTPLQHNPGTTSKQSVVNDVHNNNANQSTRNSESNNTLELLDKEIADIAAELKNYPPNSISPLHDKYDMLIEKRKRIQDSPKTN